jgi:hypothetical protein
VVQRPLEILTGAAALPTAISKASRTKSVVIDLAASQPVIIRETHQCWERPVAVVGMPSRRYPTLVRSVAEHVAAVGRLPLVHALMISGPPPAVDAASAVRAKDLLQRTALAPEVSFTGPVLLVDNTIRTRGRRP